MLSGRELVLYHVHLSVCLFGMQCHLCFSAGSGQRLWMHAVLTNAARGFHILVLTLLLVPAAAVLRTPLAGASSTLVKL